MWEVSDHLLRYNITSAINLTCNATHENSIATSFKGLVNSKGKKNETSKQEMKSISIMKHNPNFNLELASDHIADF